MKKRIWWLLLAAVVFTGGMYWYSTQNYNNNNDKDEEVIKIGAILPLTGPGAVFADYIKSGLELKLDEINKSEEKIKLFYEDSKNNPASGIAAFKKLTTVDKVQIFIPALSSVCKALIPFAGENSSLQLGTAVAFPDYTDSSSFVFRFYPNAKNVSGVMADYFNQKIEATKVSVIYVNDEFGKASFEEFKLKLKINKNLVFSESYELTQKDFKQTIEKINSSGAEAIYLSGYGPAYVSFLKQLKEMQKREYIIMGDMTLGLPNTFEQLGSLLNGVYYVDGIMSDEFILNYENKYGSKPSTYSGYAYDLLGILNLAYSNCKSKEIVKIANALYNINDYVGCMGKGISINQNREINLKFAVHKVLNNKPIVVN